jgi:hypothetical protein
LLRFDTRNRILAFFHGVSILGLVVRRVDNTLTLQGELMRFAVFVKATKDSEAGVMPTPEAFAAMEAFNEGLERDGYVLAPGEGLHPSSKGARITYAGGETTVRDGPFSETKELIAGFGVMQARSLQDLIERLRSAPFARGEEIEIRQIFSPEDFEGIA